MAATVSTMKPFSGARALQGRARARAPVAVKAAERQLWLGGMTAPSHLDGTLPGDNGFDPLGLGTDAERLAWFVEAERYNGRWAMAATVGILGQELLVPDVKWWMAGAQEYPLPVLPTIAVEFVVMGALEVTRYQGWKKTGECGIWNTFPFDPVNMTSQAMRTREVKNGRLAMISLVGYAVQALVTREGPLEGLNNHIASPFTHNITANLLNLPEVIGK